MKVKQCIVSIRMEKSLKEEAEELLHELGLNMSTACNIFLRQTVRLQKIPFRITTKCDDANDE